MLIKKHIETAIDIKNCINIFINDDNIMQILIDRYEGKCYAGCYIVSILRIVRKGECMINNSNANQVYGTIPITMEISGIVYLPGEIINGCTVSHINDISAICVTDTASIMIPGDVPESIKVTQMISVRVIEAKYTISAPKCSIIAVLFMVHRNDVIYKVIQDEMPGDELLDDVLQRIAQEEELVVDLQQKKNSPYNNFKSLLYPYNTPPPALSAKSVNIVDYIKNIGDAKRPPHQFICRSSSIHFGDPTMYIYDNPETYESKYPTQSIVLYLLEDYCGQLRTLREMTEIYSTEAIITQHRNIWQLFKKNKI